MSCGGMRERIVCNSMYSLVVASGANMIDEFACTSKQEVEGMYHFGENSTNCNWGRLSELIFLFTVVAHVCTIPKF